MGPKNKFNLSGGSTYPKLEKMRKWRKWTKYTDIFQTVCMLSACVCMGRGQGDISTQCHTCDNVVDQELAVDQYYI